METWEAEVDEKKHRILKGDWIIREPAEAPSYFSEDQAKAALISKFIGFEAPDHDSFSDHAIYVLDATQSHLTVFDPMLGRILILLYDRFPGTWHYATEQQVATTWDLAVAARPSAGMQINMEKDKFKWSPQVKR